MKTKRRRLLILSFLSAILILSLGITSVVYANSLGVKDIVTQNDFHLATSPVVEIDIGGPGSGDSEGGITGNLFTFTHSVEGWEVWGVSDSGQVVSWSSSNTATADRGGKISGSFIIDKAWWEPDDIDDQIFVSFIARSVYVPLLGTENPLDENYNFRGSFRITGGKGFYEGISGAGTIAGTLQDHVYGNGSQGVEFVMIGKAFAR